MFCPAILHCHPHHHQVECLGRHLTVDFHSFHGHDMCTVLSNINCSYCTNSCLCSDFYLCTSRWDLLGALTPLDLWSRQVQVFHFLFLAHAPVGTQCLAWSHMTTSTPSFATEPALHVPQNLLHLLTSFSHKRMRLVWAFFSLSLGSYNFAVNALAANRAASLLLIPRVVRAMKWSTPFCITTLQNCFLPNSKQGGNWVASC